MSRVNPPYRADIVGSFLRPAAVKEARAQFAAGTLSREALTAVENDAIRDLVTKEKGWTHRRHRRRIPTPYVAS